MKKKPVKEAPVEKKPWSITQADIDSITRREKHAGTTRLLPPADEIPKEFWTGGKSGTANVYVRIAEAIYIGAQPEHAQVDFNPGFTGHNINECLLAHLNALDPEYEHKIAGVAYMISKIMHVTMILNK